MGQKIYFSKAKVDKNITDVEIIEIEKGFLRYGIKKYIGYI